MGALDEIKAFVDKLSPPELEALLYDWKTWARPSQLAPPGDWSIWLIMAGRGFGKSRAGAEWVIEKARSMPGSRGAIISMDAAAARDVCIEGESGIVARSPPSFKPVYEPSKRRITWPNGSTATLFTSMSPEDLRGPQFHWAWGDELSSWENLQMTWDMLMFGLRLGKNPQVAITTTPKPVPLVRKLWEEAKLGKGRVVMTHGTTYDNRMNLAPAFFKEIITSYEGSTLGRQELLAELIDPEESGIIKRTDFKLWPAEQKLPRFKIIIQSYDTAFTEKTENDPTACTTWGVFEREDGFGVLLLDSWDDHLTYPDLRKKVQAEWGATYGDNECQADYLLIEEKGSGISLIQDLRLGKIPVMTYNPGRADKTQRLNAVSHLFRHGKVWLMESNKHPGKPVSWAEKFVSQICSFPNVEHDDYVDTATQALQMLRDQKWLTVDLSEEETFDYYAAKKRRENPYAQ